MRFSAFSFSELIILTTAPSKKFSHFITYLIVKKQQAPERGLLEFSKNYLFFALDNSN